MVLVLLTQAAEVRMYLSLMRDPPHLSLVLLPAAWETMRAVHGKSSTLKLSSNFPVSCLVSHLALLPPTSLFTLPARPR